MAQTFFKLALVFAARANPPITPNVAPQNASSGALFDIDELSNNGESEIKYPR